MFSLMCLWLHFIEMVLEVEVKKDDESPWDSEVLPFICNYFGNECWEV